MHIAFFCQDPASLLQAFAIQRQAAQLLPLVQQLQQQKRNANFLKALQGFNNAARSSFPPVLPPFMHPFGSQVPLPTNQVKKPVTTASMGQDPMDKALNLSSRDPNNNCARKPASSSTSCLQSTNTSRTPEDECYSSYQAPQVAQALPAFPASVPEDNNCHYNISGQASVSVGNVPASLYQSQPASQCLSFTPAQSQRTIQRPEPFTSSASYNTNDHRSSRQAALMPPKDEGTVNLGQNTIFKVRASRGMTNRQSIPGCNPLILPKDPTARAETLDNLKMGFTTPQPPRPRLSLQPAPKTRKKDVTKKVNRGKKEMNVNVPAFTPSGVRPKMDDKTTKAPVPKKKDAVIESSQIPDADKPETVVPCGKSKKGSKAHLNVCSEAGLSERLGCLSKTFSNLSTQLAADSGNIEKAETVNNHTVKQDPSKEVFNAQTYGFFASPTEDLGEIEGEALETEDLQDGVNSGNTVHVDGEQDKINAKYLISISTHEFVAIDKEAEVQKEEDARANSIKIDRFLVLPSNCDPNSSGLVSPSKPTIAFSEPLRLSGTQEHECKSAVEVDSQVVLDKPRPTEDDEDPSLQDLYNFCLIITKEQRTETADIDSCAGKDAQIQRAPEVTKWKKLNTHILKSKTLVESPDKVQAISTLLQSRSKSIEIVAPKGMSKKILDDWELPESLKCILGNGK